MQGYMIGNGVTAEQKYDGNALLPFAHGMALISDDLYRVSSYLILAIYNPHDHALLFFFFFLQNLI